MKELRAYKDWYYVNSKRNWFKSPAILMRINKYGQKVVVARQSGSIPAT
jgi:hypothetical protein